MLAEVTDVADSDSRAETTPANQVLYEGVLSPRHESTRAVHNDYSYGLTRTAGRWQISSGYEL